MAELFSTKSVTFFDIHYPDMVIDDNQVTFITGDSGTGKSTLLKMFNNILTPASGTVSYRQKNVMDLDPIQLRREALLVNQEVFLTNETVEKNFAFFHGFREESPPSEDDMKLYLEECQAAFPLDADVTTMSGGERQRVFIAICLSFSPRVLMLDEPTSALDSENADKLFDNLKRVGKEKNMTLVSVSHDRDLVKRYAENTIVLERKAQ
ncbi:MAG: ABC transporter ATP-binding protein [Planctomycetaceae bacterium]|nr:ABC transporter ATP-binding protein [Planctomycetaceae bacterium]